MGNWLVDYCYLAGGCFKKGFRHRKEARAFCIELMLSKSISWVNGTHHGKRFFPLPQTPDQTP